MLLPQTFPTSSVFNFCCLVRKYCAVSKISDSCCSRTCSTQYTTTHKISIIITCYSWEKLKDRRRMSQVPASEWQSQDSNLGSPTPEATLNPTAELRAEFSEAASHGRNMALWSDSPQYKFCSTTYTWIFGSPWTFWASTFLFCKMRMTTSILHQGC